MPARPGYQATYQDRLVQQDRDVQLVLTNRSRTSARGRESALPEPLPTGQSILILLNHLHLHPQQPHSHSPRRLSPRSSSATSSSLLCNSDQKATDFSPRSGVSPPGIAPDQNMKPSSSLPPPPSAPGTLTASSSVCLGSRKTPSLWPSGSWCSRESAPWSPGGLERHKSR